MLLLIIPAYRQAILKPVKKIENMYLIKHLYRENGKGKESIPPRRQPTRRPTHWSTVGRRVAHFLN